MPSSPGSSRHPRQKPRILIVDDVPEVRQDLRQLLELSGDLEIVAEAANGQEAVAIVEALHPDIVLMDLAMPVMDGYEAARQIKARWPDCRIVAFSVHSYPQARQKAGLVGVDGFIEKGASLHTILQVLNSDQ